MLRADGLSTNFEMLTNFTAASSEVLNVALEREILSPAFEDKPLQFINLNVLKTGLPRYSAFGSEDLDVRPLKVTDVDGFSASLWHPSESATQHYTQLAEIVGSAVMQRATWSGKTLPPLAVRASYTATLTEKDEDDHNRRLQVATFVEKPNKAVIITGQAFAEEALGYVKSDEFEMDVTQKAAHWKEAGENREGLICHSFTLESTPDLPLNGQESPRFLRGYLSRMGRRYDYYSSQLEKLQGMGRVPQILIDEAEASVHKYDAAVQRTLKIMDHNDL